MVGKVNNRSTSSNYESYISEESVVGIRDIEQWIGPEQVEEGKEATIFVEGAWEEVVVGQCFLEKGKGDSLVFRVQWLC